jgi:hypothetical protein
MGMFSLIKIDVTSIRLFPYIKDKATMDLSLNHGDDLPKESLSETNWNDFKEPIIGTLIPNLFITYFGQDLPHGDIGDDEIKAKLVCLGTGYELWANTANNAVKKLDDILSVMESKLLNQPRSTLTPIEILSPSLWPRLMAPLML